MNYHREPRVGIGHGAATARSVAVPMARAIVSPTVRNEGILTTCHGRPELFYKVQKQD